MKRATGIALKFGLKHSFRARQISLLACNSQSFSLRSAQQMTLYVTTMTQIVTLLLSRPARVCRPTASYAR
jgi:hypothetical protein